MLLVESTRVFARRRFHRQKAHLLLSGLRHRAAELGDQARLLRVEGYSEALAAVDEPLEVPEPTSRGAERFVRGLDGVIVVRNEGWATHRDEFRAWADRRPGRLLMEDFYRDVRRRHRLLMDGDEPVGGRWNLDHDNREPPPRRATLGVPDPWWPEEDEIDAGVRRDLDELERTGAARFVGEDGPRRFAVTAAEARAALDSFLARRLSTFGPHEDAMLAADWPMSHSLLSPALNLGLLHPLDVVRAAEAAYRSGDVPLSSAEGFIRQVVGWREYVWGIYWYGGPDYAGRNALGHSEPVPQWMWDLDETGSVDARCLSDVLRGVRERGWVHHIPRLMVLANYGLQRGWDPAEFADWFHYSFVDGYAWVMVANVVGMSQHADGGLMTTKPYAAGGAYVDRMSDYCGGCRYDPKVRVGDDACPFTAGYWWFVDRSADALAGNPRMRQALAGRLRLRDLPAVVVQEQERGSSPP